MKRQSIARTSVAIAAALLVAAAPLAAAQYQKIKGEVVAVGPATQASGGMVQRQVTVRDRQGVETHLRLREQAACQGCLQVGDHVRARLHQADGSGAARRVQSMQVSRQGSQWQYREADQGWRGAGNGAGRGTGDQQRQRIHTPGTGGGSGSGQGGGGQGHRGRG